MIKMSARLQELLNQQWKFEIRDAKKYGWEPDFKMCIAAIAFGGYIRKKKGVSGDEQD
ncbi:hypothetical protein ACFQ40_01120 [Kroppenstedtia eburnea]|uniref:hypothetical protein n=1 Tax=Kroppenstedtia eburnea TaxID=714067 RepID=UPI0036448B59